MPILALEDKERYFPRAPQQGEELAGLMALVQSLAEGPIGANRPLELASFEECYPLHPPAESRPFYWAAFRYLPVVAVVHVWYLEGLNWAPLDESLYVFEPILGRLLTDHPAREVRVEYQSGFNFEIATPDTVRIKSVAGKVLEHFALNIVGRSSSTSNPAGAAIDSYSLVPTDRHLETMLQPLKQYGPMPGAIA